MGEYTDILGEIHIGNNCFIEENSIILPGVVLADNTIIGAGSVVSKSVLTEGYIIGGNSAKIICSVDNYKNKNINNAFNLNGFTKGDMIKLTTINKDKLLKRKNFYL